jgi:hypothetical protein
LKPQTQGGEGKMTENRDRRRWGIIEVRFRPGPPTLYRLTIAGQLWAAVEWSSSRRAWCIEDAAGRCLAHCEHVHGEHLDAQTAVALAKQMIRDGRVPAPEEAERQLQAKMKGTLMPPIPDDEVAIERADLGGSPPRYRRAGR